MGSVISPYSGLVQYKGTWFPGQHEGFITPDEHADLLRVMKKRQNNGTGLGGTPPLGRRASSACAAE
jgi:hypothetical protein